MVWQKRKQYLLRRSPVKKVVSTYRDLVMQFVSGSGSLFLHYPRLRIITHGYHYFTHSTRFQQNGRWHAVQLLLPHVIVHRPLFLFNNVTSRLFALYVSAGIAMIRAESLSDDLFWNILTIKYSFYYAPFIFPTLFCLHK